MKYGELDGFVTGRGTNWSIFILFRRNLGMVKKTENFCRTGFLSCLTVNLACVYTNEGVRATVRLWWVVFYGGWCVRLANNY